MTAAFEVAGRCADMIDLASGVAAASDSPDTLASTFRRVVSAPIDADVIR